jgi:hypothetical protein
MLSKIELYKSFHLNPSNFQGESLIPHIENIKLLIENTNSKTALDFGCGKASLYYNNNIHLYWGIEIMGLYDPAIELINTIQLDNFDCIISTDVLEHIPESEIIDTLSLIFKLSNKCVYLNIAMYPANTILSNGENAHCTVKSIQWWKDQFEKTIKDDIEVHVIYSYSYGNNDVYEIYRKAK